MQFHSNWFEIALTNKKTNIISNKNYLDEIQVRHTVKNETYLIAIPAPTNRYRGIICFNPHRVSHWYLGPYVRPS